ncbi:IS256 family transposase [Methyloceanibacter sp.]|uniref:IS256 family transposase n=1 Tax=Methyloceanibacter sp. TaxID=1965321 RepID=UPI002D5B7A1B|nr:IS256 family transposase [Methyloceanibacter sp.]HZP09864.1 IS256 family transposase [Methyloceanibacter sp.]
MAIRDELLKELLAEYKKPEDLLGPNGLLKQLTGALVEKALQAELTEHLGYEKHAPAGRGSGNSRNGASGKTLKTEAGEVAIEVPRDRNATFEPQLVKKHQTHFDGFDDKIISMYARGMTVREIQGHLRELYGTEVSPDLISRVTDAVLDEVKAWQSRPLDAVWPIVYLDALVVKIRDQGTVTNKSAYLAVGVNMHGTKEVLGLWLESNEGAKFWLKIITELKNRGVADMLLVCCDGLKGFPEAIEAAFPRSTVQTCIVHMIRNSVRFVAWADRKPLVAALKPIYSADTEAAAEAALTAFERGLGQRYPMIGKSWRANWQRVIPFLAFPRDIRKAIYTTNAIESLNFQLRKIIKTRGHFPSDDAAFKLLYLALSRAQEKWTMPIRNWKNALNQFAVHFEGRLPV